MGYNLDFDRFAQEYDFWMSTVNGPARYLGLLKLLPAETGTVLDVGCGAGQLALFLADFADHVTGLDRSSAMIGRAKQHHKENLDFLVGDIETYEADSPGYDLVVSDYALHNTDLQRALPNLQRLVRPGGRLLVRDLVAEDPQRWRSATWQRWRALQDAPVLRREHGWQAMWRILRFRLSPAWIEHVRHDAVLTAAAAQAIYERFFPGCVLRVAGTEMTLLWEAPQPTQHTAPAAVTPPAAQRTGIPDSLRFRKPPPWTVERFSKSHVETSIVQVFEQQVAQYGGRQAIRAGDKALTYAELNAAANRLARAIGHERGAAEEPVAILLSQDTAILVALLAALKAGKAYVALDPGQPAERLRAFLADAQARVLITATSHLDGLSAIIPADCQIVNIDQLDPDLASHNLDLRITPDHLAGIFYTSGSTGEPKGIVRQHRQILHSTWHNTNAYGITSADRHSLLGFCGHTATVPDIFDSLLNGATLCLFDPRQHSLAELADWLIREQITLFHPPVELFRRFLSTLHGSDNFPTVRMVILAGQTVLPQDVAQFRRYFAAPCILLHRLASTETGAVAHLLIDRETPIGDRVPVGFATADKEILILDEAGQPVAAGEAGEIAIRSRYLAAGYWRQPELTAAKFLADPGGGEERVYLTGDMGQLTSDGLLEHLGRKDFLVKIRGYRVQLEAVEAALRNVPLVRDAAVGAYEMADGGQRLVGYVVPQAGQTPSASELRWRLSRNLPDYMIPTAWMVLDNLPVTAAGKVDRRLLPPPTFTHSELDTPFVAPRSELEQQIADIWAELLELDEVGIDDNFFELGGDSLSLLHLTLLVEERLGLSIPSEYYRAPTINNLTRILSGEPGAEPSASVHVGLAGAVEEASPTQWEAAIYGQGTSPIARIRSAMLRRGPAYRSLALPYVFGTRLQRAWLRQRAIQNWVFREQSQLFRRCLADTGLADPQNTYLTLNLMGNTWISWRMQALQSPSNFTHWVALEGAEQIQAAANRENGLIIVFTHQRFSGPLTKQLLLGYGIPETRVVGGARPGSDMTSEEAGRAQHARDGLDLLRRGGAVLIAGEGRDTANPVRIPFYGRRLPIPRGFAELALHSQAAVAAVFSDMSIEGRVTLEFTLLPTPTTLAEAGDLIRHYGDMLVERWPRLLPTTVWARLQYIQSLPIH